MKHLMNWWLICWMGRAYAVYAAAQMDSEGKVTCNFYNCRAYS